MRPSSTDRIILGAIIQGSLFSEAGISNQKHGAGQKNQQNTGHKKPKHTPQGHTTESNIVVEKLNE